MLPACFPDLDPASNLLLKTPSVGNDHNSVSGLGFGSWLGTASLAAGCISVAGLGWQWETKVELAGRILSCSNSLDG